MTRRAAPLLIDRLPVYATDDDLLAALFGERAGKQDVRAAWDRLTRRQGFPSISYIFGGRYVPRVLEWFDAFEGDTLKQASPPDGNERETSWNTKGPRRSAASSTGR